MPYQHELDSSKYNHTEAYREHGNGKYFAEGETFAEVVARDKVILEAAGVTHQEVGQSLRQLLSSYNMFSKFRAPGPQFPIPGVKMGCQIFDLGAEYSPYIKGLYSNIDWYIWLDNVEENGNKAHHLLKDATVVSDMMPEMIEQLGFFEGSLFYGIQPEWAIEVHKLVQAHNPTPYVPVFEKRAWDAYKFIAGIHRYTDGKHNFLNMKKAWADKGNPFPVDVIKQNTIHTEDITGGIRAFVAPGNLNLSTQPWNEGYYSGRNANDPRKNEYWALIVAYKDARIAPEDTLMGLPIAKHKYHLEKGDIELWRVFPFFDKQVG